MAVHGGVTPRRRADAAYRDSISEPIVQVVATLRDDLGANLLAYILGKSASMVNKWAAGRSEVPSAAEGTLRTVFYVRTVLSDDSPHVFRAWMIGFNPQLDDATPAEEVRDGRGAQVLAAARAFAVGG